MQKIDASPLDGEGTREPSHFFLPKEIAVDRVTLQESSPSDVPVLGRFTHPGD